MTKVDSKILELLGDNNPSLTLLNLSWNKIGVGGAQELAQALQKNSGLTWLDLADNNIGDESQADLDEVARYLSRNINNKIAEANVIHEQAATLLNSDSLVEVNQSLKLLNQAIKLANQINAIFAAIGFNFKQNLS